MDGDLEWRMVSTTSVERPESMSWAPSGQAHSFHSSGWGWNLEPPAWGRRSLQRDQTGSSRGGTSRRYIKSGNQSLPSHRGAMRSSRTRSRRTLRRTTGSRAIGENAYRLSLGKASATSVSSHPVREALEAWGRTRVNSETSLKTQTDPLVLCWTPSISAPPSWGGASIPRA